MRAPITESKFHHDVSASAESSKCLHMSSGEAMFFSRQDRRNLSVDNHAMSVTTETATRISMLAQKGSQSLPSSSRSSVHLFTFWPNGDGENSSGLLEEPRLRFLPI